MRITPVCSLMNKTTQKKAGSLNRTFSETNLLSGTSVIVEGFGMFQV